MPLHAIWSFRLQHPPTTVSTKLPCSSTDSATASCSILDSLHWLPIHKQVTFKLACLIYRSLHETSPIYLSSLLHVYVPTRALQSCSAHLVEPRLRTTLASRGFWSGRSRIWNSLPNDQTCSLYLLAKIKTQNSPLCFNLSINGVLHTNVLHHSTLQLSQILISFRLVQIATNTHIAHHMMKMISLVIS